jgi:gentisate 1,2-dioxygenase
MSDQTRTEYYARVGAMDLSPLWTTRLVPPLPRDQVKARPHLWDYDRVVRPVLLDAGPLITAKEAQRRVLTLENPGLGGSHRILESLYAGLQLILPGEVAPAHRHSPSALRFIIEGDGAYTAVSGEKSVMKPGDFIITPSMTWHDHGHEGAGPVVWMDGLDIPMLGLFGAMFFDPYERSREALEQLRRTAEWDPAAGLKLEYIDPTRGFSAMPTISTFLQLLPKGFSGTPYRTTENTVYTVVEGGGRAIIGDGDDAIVLSWRPRDIFAIPCWVPHRLESDDDATLFSFSDRTAQVKLGIWREDRGNA